jgi:hypothetical protein
MVIGSMIMIRGGSRMSRWTIFSFKPEHTRMKRDRTSDPDTPIVRIGGSSRPCTHELGLTHLGQRRDAPYP